MTADHRPSQEDVERRVAMGLTPEMAAASRRRFVVLQGFILMSLVFNLVAALAGHEPSSWQVVVNALAVVVVAALVVRGYQRLGPRVGRAVSGEELAAVATMSRRCERCECVVLPEEDECPRCGSVKHPRLTLTFGVAFGVGMTLLALWRVGVLGK
jgi:uncharacterized paraquat-inducible protein A